MADEGELLADEPIRPPRLEDAGLEDCALPPESIAEAFSLATKAVSSRLAHLPLSDEDEDEGDVPLAPRGGCLDDAGPTCGATPNAGGGSVGGCADKVVMVSGSGANGDGGDEVVVEGRGDEEDRVVVVVGEEQEGKLGWEKGCVEVIREGVGGLGRGEGNGEEEEVVVVVAVEKAILVEDFA